MDQIFGNFLPLLTTALAVGLVYFHIKRFTFWSSRGIKGPIPVPFLGTNVYYIFKKKPEQDKEWQDKYGLTFGLYEGYDPVLRTCDNEILKHVYIKKFSDFTDRNNKLIFGQNIKRWLLWSKGEHWSNQRVLVTPSFTSLKLRTTFFKPMKKCVDRFIGEATGKVLDEVSKRPVHNEKKVFSKDDYMALTLDLISSTFFGIQLNTYQDKTSDFFKRAFAFSSFDVGFFMIWLWIPTFICKYFEIDLLRYKKYEYFDKLSQSIINERLEEQKKNHNFKPRDDVIQTLLDAELPDKHETVYTKEDNDYNHYNDKIDYKELDRIHEGQTKSVKFRKFSNIEIRGQMTFFFLAGFETTSNSLSFLTYELAHHPQVQSELFKELSQLDLIVPSEDNYSQLMSAKKLDAFISEVLRLYSPVAENNRIVTNPEGVWLPLPNRTPVFIPKGTVISTNPMILQRHPKYWTNPDQLDITRFYPENKDKIKSATYMPFGLGPRNCVGMRFALLNLKLSLANLILNYEVTPGPNTQAYPPTFAVHSFFHVMQHTDFCLSPRIQSS